MLSREWLERAFFQSHLSFAFITACFVRASRCCCIVSAFRHDAHAHAREAKLDIVISFNQHMRSVCHHCCEFNGVNILLFICNTKTSSERAIAQHALKLVQTASCNHGDHCDHMQPAFSFSLQVVLHTSTLVAVLVAVQDVQWVPVPHLVAVVLASNGR